jgi:hypothetical protein
MSTHPVSAAQRQAIAGQQAGAPGAGVTQHASQLPQPATAAAGWRGWLAGWTIPGLKK